MTFKLNSVLQFALVYFSVGIKMNILHFETIREIAKILPEKPELIVTVQPHCILSQGLSLGLISLDICKTHIPSTVYCRAVRPAPIGFFRKEKLSTQFD